MAKRNRKPKKKDEQYNGQENNEKTKQWSTKHYTEN
jgi:hypothetical protein